MHGTQNGRAQWRRRTRDSSEWIEVEGATPKIVDPKVFEAAQKVLNDPEHRGRGRRVYEYSLSDQLISSFGMYITNYSVGLDKHI